MESTTEEKINVQADNERKKEQASCINWPRLLFHLWINGGYGLSTEQLLRLLTVLADSSIQL